jgi:hypothetical protein
MLLVQLNRVFYRYRSIIRIFEVKEDEMGRSCSMHGEKKEAYRILVGTTGGKRPLGRPRCKWKDNIKMNLRETGWGNVDWTDLAQDMDRWRALVNTVLNLRVP